MLDLERIAGELRRRTGTSPLLAGAKAVAGGSISRAYRLPTRGEPLFVKLGGEEALPAFEAEAEGLAALRAAAGVAVPETVDLGCAGGTAYLALAWIELTQKTAAAECALGTGLARQHRATAERFGWHRDNTLGATLQRNTLTQSWNDFLREERLGFQLELARGRGLPEAQAENGRRLLQRLDSLLGDHEPEASLLHGDLWSGNWGCDASGTPYVYDPAVYYGDREADLAMTRLFGGFGPAFYAAYSNEWPLPAGWQARVELYNLYHLLNHFNLFGGAYLAQTAASLQRLSSR